MGTDAHVVVVGDHALLDDAVARIHQLEQRWSRFLPDSEVSRLTAAAGHHVSVSADTVLLVEQAVAAYWFSGGTFDPTVLGDLLRAGYDRTFDELVGAELVGASVSDLRPGCAAIEVGDGTVRLPAGTGFDPGGIGKGLAADVVVGELLAAGAEGACVNIGGDLRVAGSSPTGGAWTVAVEHPERPHPLALLGLTAGAVATSTTLRRRWSADGALRHHLIDPGTGAPSTSDLALVTVVASEGWAAEVLAKSLLLRGSAHDFGLLGGTGAEALTVTEDGVVAHSSGLGAFLATEATVPS